MVRKRKRYSDFDKVTNFVLNRIRKHRSITLIQFQRILCSNFKRNYFHKQKNVNIIMDVMEYLLYTKRLIIVNPNEQHDLQAGMSVNNNNFVVYSIITKELLSKFKNAFNLNPSNILAQNMCTIFDPFQAALSRNTLQDQQIVGTGNPISNQKNSGRCWIFACLNVIRVPFMKKYNIKQFEFSQAYLFFWDKIERSNYFLNAIVQAAKGGYSLESRTVMWLLKNPIEDGGYWSIAVNIIKKYGLMPKTYFPESYSSENSKELNEILNSKLREFAITLHNMVFNKALDKHISEEIKKNMYIIFRIVGICLGIPKPTFKWYYRVKIDEPDLYHIMTPLEFYKSVVRPIYNLDNKVSLICDPRENNKFGQLYTLNLIGTVMEGFLYNNQPIEVLLDACHRSITVFDEPVWYSCEVNQRFSNELGFQDLHIQDIKSLFGTDISITMTKSERISYRDSSPTHAMVLAGVHVENNEVIRWCVENSWGKHLNINGYIMMSTEWFKEYVFEVVVDKKLLPQCVLDVFNQKPIVLPIWDQLGSLLLVN